MLVKQVLTARPIYLYFCTMPKGRRSEAEIQTEPLPGVAEIGTKCKSPARHEENFLFLKIESLFQKPRPHPEEA
jgi:hypothetical protein